MGKKKSQEPERTSPVGPVIVIAAPIITPIVLQYLPKTRPVVASVLTACFAVVTYVTWNLPSVRKSAGRRLVAVGVLVVILAFVMAASLPPSEIKPPKDSVFVPVPKGRLRRVTGYLPASTAVLCSDVKNEAERIACLCPRPVKATLESLPTPATDNYATAVIVTTPREPMYRVRIFLRDVYSDADLLKAAPHFGDDQTSGVWTSADDKLSFGFFSTAPQEEFRARVLSSTGLRILCATQEN